jgi:hypothetical protein
MSTVICPACQAANVMRQRMVHDSGTSTTTSTTTGVGGVVGSGGVAPGVFAASSSGQQQSALAKKCAPPAKEPVIGPIVMAVVIFLITLPIAGRNYGGWDWISLSIGGAISAFCVFGAVVGFIENRTKLPAKLAEYEKKWICLTCGHTWERDQPTA